MHISTKTVILKLKRLIGYNIKVIYNENELGS